MNEILNRAIKRADEEISGVKLQNLSPDAALFGEGKAILDSLNLVTFIFIIEDEFLKITGKKIKISAQEIVSKSDCPFRTLRTLEAYLRRKNEG